MEVLLNLADTDNLLRFACPPVDAQKPHSDDALFPLFALLAVCGWTFFALTACALVKKRRLEQVARHTNHAGQAGQAGQAGHPKRAVDAPCGPCVPTATDGLFLFSEVDYEQVVEPLASNSVLFELMWTEKNQDKTVAREVFGARSMFMGKGRAMFIVNDFESTIVVKTPLFISDLELFVSSRKDLFATRPFKLTLVVIGWEQIVLEGHQLSDTKDLKETNKLKELKEFKDSPDCSNPSNPSNPSKSLAENSKESRGSKDPEEKQTC